MATNPTVKVISEHEREVLDLAKHAKRRFTVVSPWLSESVLGGLLRIMQDGVQLEVIFRWPQARDTPGFLDVKALRLLLDSKRANVKASFVAGPLHAKVYYSDPDAVIVSSANFTGSGMGSHLDSNIELGLRADEAAPAVAEWIDALDRVTFDTAALNLLSPWLEQDTTGKFTAPPLPPGQAVPEGRGPAIAAAIARLRTSGFVGDAVKVEEGAGIGVFELSGVKKTRRRSRRVRVCTSTSDASGREFHFDLTWRDLAASKVPRGSPGHLGGLLLVPVTTAAGMRLHPEAPVVLLPFEHLFERYGGVLHAALPKGRQRRCKLERDGDHWTVVVPNATGRGKREGSAVMVVELFGLVGCAKQSIRT